MFNLRINNNNKKPRQVPAHTDRAAGIRRGEEQTETQMDQSAKDMRGFGPLVCTRKARAVVERLSTSIGAESPAMQIFLR